jgi:hypothetical protein
MRTVFTSLSAGLLACTLFGFGCGSGDVGDEIDLSALPLVSEDDKSDMPAGASGLTFTRPSSSTLQCVRAPCPSNMIYDVNTGALELTYAYDWRALKLTKSEEENAKASASKMLLYGRYAPAKAFGETVKVFQILRANMRVAERAYDAPDSDRYYSTMAATPNCPQGQCPLTAQLLNDKQMPTVQWQGVDLTRLELGPTASAALLSELAQGKAYVSIVNRQTPSSGVVPVTQVFRPLTAAPLPQ